MSQYYSDPSREADPHALPDIEVFYAEAGELDVASEQIGHLPIGRPGFFYWYCSPGCLPDGCATGPFATEADAVAAMRAETEQT